MYCARGTVKPVRGKKNGGVRRVRGRGERKRNQSTNQTEARDKAEREKERQTDRTRVSVSGRHANRRRRVYFHRHYHFVCFSFYRHFPESHGGVYSVARVPRVLFRSFVCQIFIERFGMVRHRRTRNEGREEGERERRR